MLFGEKEKLLELYNAIENKNYGMDTDIKITTLGSAVYKGVINDISFVIDGKLVVLIEHQSTINENMPLRMLIYLAESYKKVVNPNTLYDERRIPIPKPEFIVLYNGKDKFSDHETYKLSDMYTEPGLEGLGKLELEVEVYNINEGRNAEMVKRSEALKGYSYFVYLAREYAKTMDIDAAIKRAINDCISQGMLEKFLKENSRRIFNMLLDEWNWDTALAKKEEAGIAIGKEEDAKAMLAEGMSVALIAKITGLGKDEIESLR
jgi:predicted transposase/invertase (TIGR01784 family)